MIYSFLYCLSLLWFVRSATRPARLVVETFDIVGNGLANPLSIGLVSETKMEQVRWNGRDIFLSWYHVPPTQKKAMA